METAILMRRDRPNSALAGSESDRLTYFCGTLNRVVNKNVTLSLPEPLLRRFRIYAARRNESMTRLMAEAVRGMVVGTADHLRGSAYSIANSANLWRMDSGTSATISHHSSP